MRCPHCRHESNEPARFCTWCGAPLAGAVGATAMPRDTRAYTPRHLAEKILTMRSALEGERKHLSILFVDVVDSMRLAEKLDAEEWHRVLDRVFEILAAAIHGVEGTINQFTGDGVMALFGAPIAHEDHARRACQAALAAREALRVYAETLRPRGVGLAVRMGINSDEVVVGKIGDDLRMDYTAQGQPVGLAARVQQLAEPGTVLLTENTARLVEGFCILSDAGVRSVKGVSAPIRVLELSAMGPARTRLDAAGRRGLTRLIGRDTELTWLEGILARSIGADGQVVGVVGEAGVGKSRLCLEFARRSRARGVALYEVHCPAHAVAVPRFAIRELLRSFLGLTQTDEVEAMRRSVAEQLRTLDAALTDTVPLVLDVLGVGDGAADSPRMTTDLGGFMRRLLRARSAAQPTLVLIDDAHWMDPASHELVCKLAAAARGTRTLLLTNFRPEYRPAWTGGAHYHQLALSPLGAEAARELLDELLGSHGALSGLAASILERTGGNPFFTEEVVQALVGAGNLVGARGAYRLAAPIEALALPATVQALLASRIDQLGEVAKHVLQTAAVIGKQFDEPLLREASGVAGPRELDAALADLEDLDFVRLVALSPHPAYAFKHPLMADVAYRSQLGERRTQLHAAVAAALEKLHADRLGEYASLIAHHWEASGMRFEASRWKRRAALNVANIKIGQHRRRPRP
jgi:class 3 adenylate cyclase